MGKTTKSKLSILVVDDDENILLVLRQSLEKEGYHVSTAKSAEEALNTLQRSFFHVVITDIMMGEMSGVELLMEIKKMNFCFLLARASEDSKVIHQCAPALSCKGERGCDALTGRRGN